MTVTAPAGVAGQVILSGSLELDVNHTAGTTDIVPLYIGTTTTGCTTYSGYFLYPAAAPAGFFEITMGVAGTFAQAAGTTTTYYLNMYALSGTGAYHYYSRLNAVFVPN